MLMDKRDFTLCNVLSMFCRYPRYKFEVKY